MMANTKLKSEEKECLTLQHEKYNDEYEWVQRSDQQNV